MAEWSELPSFLLEPPEQKGTVPPVPYLHCDYCDKPIYKEDPSYVIEPLYFCCSKDCAVKYFTENMLEERNPICG